MLLREFQKLWDLQKKILEKQIFCGGTPLGALESLLLTIREVPLFGGAVMRDF
jgi:hypothetical protein